MISCVKLAVLTLSVAALAACATSVSPVQKAAGGKAAVAAVSLAWKKAYNAGDTAAVAALYGEDAVLSAPGEPALRGKTAISEYFRVKVAEFSSAGLTVVDSPMGDVVASNDLAWQWKTYQITDKSGAVVNQGQLLTLFQRQGGRWVIVGDTWNSAGGPATGPGASAVSHP